MEVRLLSKRSFENVKSFKPQVLLYWVHWGFEILMDSTLFRNQNSGAYKQTSRKMLFLFEQFWLQHFDWVLESQVLHLEFDFICFLTLKLLFQLLDSKVILFCFLLSVSKLRLEESHHLLVLGVEWLFGSTLINQVIQLIYELFIFVPLPLIRHLSWWLVFFFWWWIVLLACDFNLSWTDGLLLQLIDSAHEVNNHLFFLSELGEPFTTNSIDLLVLLI